MTHQKRRAYSLSPLPHIAAMLTVALLLVPIVVRAQEGCIVTVAGIPAVVDGLPATAVRLSEPRGVAVASDGSLFVVDAFSHIIRRLLTNGTIITVAGVSGNSGFSGNGGPASSARLNFPQAVTVSPDGSLFIADSSNNAIRRVLANGIIVTVAGVGGSSGFSGDGGLAISARLNFPYGVSVSSDGSLFIADSGNHVIRRVLTNGTIITVAGIGRSNGFSGDGGLATAANLYMPYGVSVSSDGSLFIADSGNHVIRCVLTNGTIITVAGIGRSSGFSGDGSLATAAMLNFPYGVSVSSDGSIVIADSGNHAIRRVFVNGTIVTAAGIGGLPGFSGDGGLATAAKLYGAFGVSLSSEGSLFIADSYNHVIRRVLDNGTIITVLGIGISSDYGGDGGLAISARLSYPRGVSVSSNGSLYIADSNNHVVRRVLTNGTIVTAVGVGSSNGYSGDGGPASSARLSYPSGVAVSSDGSLFIADFGNHVIRHVLANGTIITVAGIGSSGGFSGDGGLAISARLRFPYGVTVSSDGSLFIADSGNHVIRCVLANGTIITVAGNGSNSGFSGDGGPAISARLNYPRGVAVSADGSLFIADFGNHVIRRVLANGAIITVAGVGRSFGFSGDGGQATSAKLYSPGGVAVSSDGSLFIADADNHAVRRVSANGTIVTVAAIGSRSGFSGDGGLAKSALLNHPHGVSVASDGSLFIADEYNHAVRRLLPHNQCSKAAIVTYTQLPVARPAPDTFICNVTLPPVPPLFVWLSGQTCSVTVPLTSSPNATWSVQCPKPRNLELPAVLQWASQFGHGLQLLNVRPVVGIDVALLQIMELGASVTFAINASSITSLLPEQTTFTTAAQPAVEMPCVNWTLGSSGNNNSNRNMTCSLLLWVEAWYTSSMHLQLYFADCWLPISINVTADSLAAMTRLQLQQIFPPLLPSVDASSFIARLPGSVPPRSLLSGFSFPHGCNCDGDSQSSVRAWVGSSIQNCTWLNASAANCTAPSLSTLGSILARVTIEICCVLNITSDGTVPSAPYNDSTADGLIVYDPASLFNAWNFPSQVTSLPTPISIALPIMAAHALHLSMATEVVLLAGSPCVSMFWNHSNHMLACKWTLPEASAPLSGSLILSVSLRIRGQLILLPISAPIVLAPNVVAVFPQFTIPGGCIAVLGMFFLGDDASSVRIHLGDDSLPCANTSHISYTAASCCVPTVVPNTVSGYPSLPILVSNNRGISRAAVSIGIAASASVSYTTHHLRYIVLPSNAQSSPVHFIRPPLTVRVSGSQQATCEVQIVAISCPQRPTPMTSSLVGLTSATVELLVEIPYADITFAEVGVSAPLGCELNMSVACVDGLGRRVTTPTVAQVFTGSATLAWNQSINNITTSTPEATIPPAVANLMLDDVTLAAVSNNTDALAPFFSCYASVLDADGALLVQAGCRMTPHNVRGQLAVVCDNTTLPSYAILGSVNRYYLKCAYLTGLDLLTVGPATVFVPTIAASMLSPPVHIDAYQPFLLDASLSMNTSDCAKASVQCGSLTFASARGRCRLIIQAEAEATVALSMTSAAAIYNVLPNGSFDVPFISTVLEGPPAASGSILLSCVLWQQAVLSNAVRFGLAPFTTRFHEPPQGLIVLPSSPNDANFAMPPVWIQSHARSSVSCSLSLASVTCPMPGFVRFGQAFAPTAIPARLVGSGTVATVVNIPENSTSIYEMFAPVGAYAAGGCQLALSASCRDGVGRNNITTTPLHVWVAQIHGDWNASKDTLTAFAALVPAALPPLSILMHAQQAPPADLTEAWSCEVVLLPAWVNGPPSIPLSRFLREAISVPTVLNRKVNASTVQMDISDLDASSAFLGSQLSLHAECTWTLTGERIRLAPLPVSIPEIRMTIVDAAHPSVPLTRVMTPTAADIPIAVQLAWLVTNGTSDLILRVPVMQCSWVTIARTSSTIALEAAAQELLASTSLRLRDTAVVPLSPLRILSAGASESLTVALQCDVWSTSVRSNMVTLASASLDMITMSALPTEFIPSDTGVRWLIQSTVVVGVHVTLSNASSPLFTGPSIRCSLGLTSADASDQASLVTRDPSTPLSAYSDIPADDHGMISFPRFGVRADFAQAAVNMSISCVRPTGDGPPILTWQMVPLPMRVQLCSPAQVFTETSTAIRVAATLAQTCEKDAILPRAWAYHPPIIVCTLQALNEFAIVQGGNAQADSATGSIVFPAAVLTAPPGAAYEIQLSCGVGSVGIPPVSGIIVQVELTGCAPGYRVYNTFCQLCEPQQYSFGGAASACVPCPAQGVSCTHGLLTLLPNYYRPHRHWGMALDASSELYPCANGEACVVNASTHEYGCSDGYTGPLCGVCDISGDYARMGDACRSCGDRRTQVGLFVLLCLAVASLLTYVALRRNDGRRSEAAIVLKIAMSYLQAVGSLRAFRAGGTKAYHDIMGWTDIVSANPLSVSSLQCVWKPPFLAQYAVTVALPLLASASVMAIFFIVSFARALRCTRAVITAKERVFLGHQFWSAVQTWIQQRRHVATLVFVLFVAYMGITSASLRVLDCLDTAIDGVTYLRSDLSVECYVDSHAAAVVMAYITLLVLGVGFPLGLFYKLSVSTEQQLTHEQFHSAWGFLYDGYRTASPLPETIRSSMAGDAHTMSSKGNTLHEPPSVCAVRTNGKQNRWMFACAQLKGGHLMWWEASVLIRKAGVVLLAVLVTNPYFQTAGAALWLGSFLCLHLYFAPYASPIFNGLETLSLMAATMTTIISGSLLQYDVNDPAFRMKPPQFMSANEWAVTGALAVVNVTTIGVLVATWLYYQCRKVSRAARAIRRKHGTSSSSTRPSTAHPSHQTAKLAITDHDSKEHQHAFLQSNPLRSVTAAGLAPAARKHCLQEFGPVAITSEAQVVSPYDSTQSNPMAFIGDRVGFATKRAVMHTSTLHRKSMKEFEMDKPPPSALQQNNDAEALDPLWGAATAIRAAGALRSARARPNIAPA